MTWTRTATTRTPTPTTLTVSEERRAEGGVSPDRRYAALAHCIAPFAANEFLEHHWERKPLLVERAAPGRFDDLLSEDDVEHAVCTSGLRYPAFRLVKAGAQLKPAEYTRDIPWRPSAFTAAADVRRVIAEFEQGATIVLQALHLHRYPLAAFCRRLEAELGHPAQANAYYTPRRSQGLPVHHDTHDVFVLQVAGHKRWLVYEPALELPLKNQRYSRALGELGEPVLDVTIAAGDTLYLPRGWLHQALTSETDSLHLTIGVNVYTWLDAYRAALDSCADDVEFRRSVPGDGRSDTDLIERFRARMTPDAIARRMRARFVETRRPILDGQLSQIRALDGLTLDTVVRRRASVISDLAVTSSALRLAFEDTTLLFPPAIRDELEFIATSTGAFRARELPGRLDARGRLVLVRRLIREGYLTIARPGERDGRSPESDGGAGG